MLLFVFCFLRKTVPVSVSARAVAEPIPSKAAEEYPGDVREERSIQEEASENPKHFVQWVPLLPSDQTDDLGMIYNYDFVYLMNNKTPEFGKAMKTTKTKQ